MEMKRIYKSMLVLAAALLLAPMAKAQDNYLLKDGFGYNKYLKSTTPDPTTGEYTLRIETFATGKVELEEKAVPSDIVLVLDASGSMIYNAIMEKTNPIVDKLIREEGTTANGGLVQYTYNNANNTTNGPNNYTQNLSAFSNDYYLRFVKYNGGYYLVQRSNSGGNIVLFFKVGSTTYYLRGKETDADGGIKTVRPTDIPTANTNTIQWQGHLYRYPSRMEVLRESVYSFVDLIAQNNAEIASGLEPGTVGNQIAVVSYTGNYTADQMTSITETQTNEQKPQVRKIFTTVDNSANVTAIKNSVSSLRCAGNTPHDAGLKLARLLLENLESSLPCIDPVTYEQKRLKTVVFFTDGLPDVSNTSRCLVAHRATEQAYHIKATKTSSASINYPAVTKPLHAKIFSVGFNATADTKKLLQYISSNYKDGMETKTTEDLPKATYVGNLIEGEGKAIYYMDADGANLKKVFEDIAAYSGGGSTAGSSSLIAIDLVAENFKLPENADATRVKVFTAQCIGTDGTFTDDAGTHDRLAFAADVEAPNRPDVPVLWVSTPKVNEQGDPVLDDQDRPVYIWTKKENVNVDGNDDNEQITIEFDKTHNIVKVGGFSYGDFWCGHDADPEHVNSEQYDPADYPSTYIPGYRGFKLIFEFPIVVNDDALGGPAVDTNLGNSGLYQIIGDTQQPLVLYPQPKLPIPVRLIIQKTGLKPGESANFTVQRKLRNSTDEYEDYTTFILTGVQASDPTPEVRIINLSPDYYYKVKEDNWSWAYQQVSTEYTTEDTTLKNPIVFENTPIPTPPPHAEAKATNKMTTWEGETSTAEFDHSK